MMMFESFDYFDVEVYMMVMLLKMEMDTFSITAFISLLRSGCFLKQS